MKTVTKSFSNGSVVTKSDLPPVHTTLRTHLFSKTASLNATGTEFINPKGDNAPVVRKHFTAPGGVEGNITGTSNGVEVDVYYRVSSPEGSWEVFEEGVAVIGGNWSATGTVPGAGTYDFRARDTVDPDGQIQLDSVVVELVAESITTLLSMTATCTADAPENTTELIGTLTIDVSCTADAPTDI